MTRLTDYTDEALLSLWRGNDCPLCQAVLSRCGALPAHCDGCGADRRAIWHELERRNLIDEVWHGYCYGEIELAD